MKNKIIICGIILTLLMACIPTANANLVTVTGDIGISDLISVVEIDGSSAKLFLWWKTNEEAQNTAGLQVNISVGDQVIGTTSANNHLDMQSAWKYDEFGTIFGTTGTYTIKVEFIDFVDPDGVNTNKANDKVQRTIYVGEGIIADILNQAYGFYFLVEQAIPETGVDFIDDLPLIPILVFVVLLIVAFVVYRHRKKKKGKKYGARPIPPRSLGHERREPLMGRVVSPYEKRYPPYGPRDYFDDEYY